jgi:PAS domain S-box-containing protein
VIFLAFSALTIIALAAVAVLVARTLRSQGHVKGCLTLGSVVVLQLAWQFHLISQDLENRTDTLPLGVHAATSFLLALITLMWTWRWLRDLRKELEVRAQLAGLDSAWQLLFQKSSEATFILDGEDRIVEANEQGCAIFGYRREEIMGRRPQEFIHPEDLKLRPLQVDRKHGVNLIVTQRRFRCADGHYIHCDVQSVALPDGRYLSSMRDISEAKKLEMALQESASVLTQSAQLAHLGHFSWDLQTDLLTCTDEVRKFLGVDKNRVLYAGSLFERIELEDLEPLLLEINHSIAECRQLEFDFRINPLTGKKRHLRMIAEPAADRLGKVVRLIGAMQDITEQKCQELALKESEERFRRVFDHSPLGICTVGTDGRILSANPAFCRTIGYNSDELERMTVFGLFPAADAPGEVQFFNDVVGQLVDPQQTAPNIPKRLRRKDGQIIWVNLSATSIFDTKGNLLYGLGIIEDITTKRSDEDTLRELLATMHHAAKMAKIGHLRLDLRTGTVAASDEIYRLLKVQTGTPLCLNDLLANTHPEDVQGNCRALEQAVTNHIRIDHQHRAILPNGEIRHLRGLGDVEYDSQGTPVSVLLTIQDITDRVQSEQALRDSEEKYRVTFENSSAATVLIEEDTIIGLTNSRFEQLSGYSKPEIEGKKSWTEFVAEEDRDRMLFQHRLRRNDRSAAPNQYEFRLVTRSGDLRNILLTVDMIPGTKRSVASLVDITASRQAEERLFKSFHANAAGIVITRLRDGCFVEVNDTFSKETGYSRDEVIGKTAHELNIWINPADRDHMVDSLSASMNVRSQECPFRTKSGATLICRYSATVIHLNGEKCALVSLIDLTESKKAELARTESEQRYGALFNEMPMAIVVSELVYDQDGNPVDYRVVDVNPTYELLLQRTRADVVGRLGREVWPRFDSLTHELIIKVALSGESTTTAYYSEGRKQRFEGTIFSHLKGEVTFAFTDVTERHRTEAALRESEERFRTLYMEAPAMMYSINRQGKIISVNRAWLATMEYAEEEVLGRDSAEFMTAECRRNTTEVVRPQFFQSGALYDVPFQFVKKSGEVVDTLLSGIPEFDAAGQIIQAMAVLRDVTQQKKAEAALLLERNLFIGGPTVTFKYNVHDQQGIDYISPNVTALLGYRSEQFTRALGFFATLMHPDDIQSLEGSLKKALETGGRSLEREYRLRRSDGEYRWIHEFLTFSRDVFGKISSLQGYLSDITARKEAEVRLRKSEERFEQVARQSREMVWEVDANGLFTYVSQACEEILGYRPSEMIGKLNYFDLHPVEGRETLRLEVAKIISERGAFRDFLDKVLTRDGRIVWVSTNAVPVLDESGNLIGYMGSDLDITDRKRTEEALRDSEEKYRTIVETASEGICIVSPQSTIAFANKTLAEAVGCTVEQVIGHPLSDFMFEDDIADHVRKTEQRAAGIAGRYERRIRRVDGSTLWCLVSASPLIDTDGRYLGAFAMFTDITASKLAQRALIQSESTYRTLIETTDTGYAIVDDNGCIVDANAEYVRLAGHRNLDEIRGKSVLDWTAPEARAANQRAIERCLEDGYVRNLEIAYVNDLGVVTPVEINASLLHDEGAVRVMALCRDISERKRSEEELRKNEAVLLSILNATPAGVALLVDRKFMKVNSALCKMTGFSEEELLGQYTRIIYLNEDEFNRAGSVLYGQLAVQGFASVEATLKNRAGTPVYVLLCLSPFDPKNLALGVTATVLDITDRKRAEETIRESERLHRSLVDLSPDGIFICTDDAIVFANDAFARMMKAQSPAEVLGLTLNQVVHSESLEFVTGRRQALTANRVNPPAEQRFLCRDNSEFLGEVSAVAIRWKDQPAAQVIVRDITDRKKAEQERLRLEEQLRVSQKLETIGTLAAGIAHDFNNLLVPVIGFTELVASDLPPEDPGSEHLAEVLWAANRAKDLVAQILSFSRQQSGDKQPLRLSSIVKEVAKLMQSSLEDSIVTVQEVDNDTSFVLADATQMHQVLMNLCVNASHAMPDGGTLTIALKDCDQSPTICPSCLKLLEGSLVHLSVSDTGLGMNEETKKRIFDPFFTTKPVGEGSGLGLAVSHGIVSHHGGHICPESEPGAGATFHVFLPIAPQSEGDETTPVAVTQRGTESILVVDDSAEVARSTAKTLESFGYRVTWILSPVDAIAEFGNNPDKYDLVISDFRMPGMNGDRLAIELLRIRPEIPIVIFSGYTDSLDLGNARGIGIREILAKPVSGPELHATIRRALAAAYSVSPQPFA